MNMHTDTRATVAAFHHAEDGVTAYVKADPRGFLVFLHDDDAGESVGFIKIFPLELRAQAIAYAAEVAGLAKPSQPGHITV